MSDFSVAEMIVLTSLTTLNGLTGADCMEKTDSFLGIVSSMNESSVTSLMGRGILSDVVFVNEEETVFFTSFTDSGIMAMDQILGEE